MGVMICKKHGHQSFFEVCEHVLHGFEKGKYGLVYEMPINGLICEGCKSKIKLEELNDLDIDDVLALPEAAYKEYELKFEEKYDQLKRNALCMKCAREMGFLQKIEIRKSNNKNPDNV